ncbi:MAG TPA: phenylacetate--CoA ligase [Bacillota bacterium]
MIWNREFETMDRSQLTRLQLERLGRVLERAYQRVPFHRRRFDEAGVKPADVTRLEDLARLPFTVKQDLRDHYPFGLFAEPLRNIARIHASSGTKGKPTVVGYTRNDLEVWAEVCARSLACAGAEPGHVLHNAYGYGLFTGGLGMHYGAEKLGMTVVPASGGFTNRQITLLQDFTPQGLCCTPSYALNLAEHMREAGVDTSRLGLRYGIFGAEPWTEELRRQVEDQLHLHAVDIYGLSEVIGPGVACECWEEKRGAHIFEDHFLVEVVDPETGEPVPDGQEGELVFTSLTKEAFPVIRYRTGDIAALVSEPCACGRTSRRMTRVKGRVDDMLIIRGVNVFPSEIERVLLTMEEAAPHYQVVVDRKDNLDRLTVQVELTPAVWAEIGDDDGTGSDGMNRLRERMEKALQQELTVRVNVDLRPPRSVPRSEGKAIRIVDLRRQQAS